MGLVSWEQTQRQGRTRQPWPGRWQVVQVSVWHLANARCAPSQPNAARSSGVDGAVKHRLSQRNVFLSVWDVVLLSFHRKQYSGITTKSTSLGKISEIINRISEESGASQRAFAELQEIPQNTELVQDLFFSNALSGVISCASLPLGPACRWGRLSPEGTGPPPGVANPSNPITYVGNICPLHL